MAEADDIQPLVCDNGTGMVKVTTMQINYPIVVRVRQLGLSHRVIINRLIDLSIYARSTR